MRRTLSRARFIALLFPLYCIFASAQVACGGGIDRGGNEQPPIIGVAPPGDGDEVGDGYDDPYGYDDDYGGYGYGNP